MILIARGDRHNFGSIILNFMRTIKNAIKSLLMCCMSVEAKKDFILFSRLFLPSQECGPIASLKDVAGHLDGRRKSVTAIKKCQNQMK